MNWLWFFFRFHLLCAICSHTHILHIFYCIATDFIFRQFEWRKTVCLNEPVMYTYKHKQWALNMNESDIFFHFQIIESFICFIIFTIQHPVRVRGTFWWLFSGALLVHPSEWAIFSEPMVLDSLIQNFRSVYSMKKLKYKNCRSICYPNSILTKYNFRLYSQNGQKDLPIIYWSISLFIDA